MALFLFLLIVAVVLGFIGVLAEGLLYLLIIGVLVAVAAVLYLGMKIRRSGRRPAR
jgi:1,4-dihydroxy-2-naphthoate octaprenyltransferase